MTCWNCTAAMGTSQLLLLPTSGKHSPAILLPCAPVLTNDRGMALAYRLHNDMSIH